MSKQGVIEMEGKVVDIVRDNIKVELSNGHVITAYLAGKLRHYYIRVMVGDVVKVELSPYDLSKGRITYRGKK